MYKVLKFSFPRYLYGMKYLLQYFVSNWRNIDCLENVLLLEAIFMYQLLTTFLTFTLKCAFTMYFREDLVLKVPEVKEVSVGQL